MKPIIAIPATTLLILRAYTKKSLTPAGLVAALATALAHAYHPWNLPFTLLAVFFLAGTRVTRVKADFKAGLTMQAQGSSTEGPRTHVQVLANSLPASILSILHAHQPPSPCFSRDVLIVGIIAHYASVAADTFSSELGILSSSEPRLITSLTLRRVPRGTNGGVTPLGLGAALLGSAIIVGAAALCLLDCQWTAREAGFMVLWGALGSVLDSVLGAVLQRTVRDVRSGKVVEGEGGGRVLVSAVGRDEVRGGSRKRAEAVAVSRREELKVDGSAVDDVDATLEVGARPRKESFGDERPSRVVENGMDLLDNNGVNLAMAVVMSVGGMAVARWHWS